MYRWYRYIYFTGGGTGHAWLGQSSCLAELVNKLGREGAIYKSTILLLMAMPFALGNVCIFLAILSAQCTVVWYHKFTRHRKRYPVHLKALRSSSSTVSNQSDWLSSWRWMDLAEIKHGQSQMKSISASVWVCQLRNIWLGLVEATEANHKFL